MPIFGLKMGKNGSITNLGKHGQGQLSKFMLALWQGITQRLHCKNLKKWHREYESASVVT